MMMMMVVMRITKLERNSTTICAFVCVCRYVNSFLDGTYMLVYNTYWPNVAIFVFWPAIEDSIAAFYLFRVNTDEKKSLQQVMCCRYHFS